MADDAFMDTAPLPSFSIHEPAPVNWTLQPRLWDTEGPHQPIPVSDWYLLSTLSGIGPAKLQTLFYEHWSLERLLNEAKRPKMIKSDHLNAMEQFINQQGDAYGAWQAIEQQCHQSVFHVLTPDHADYPPLLKNAHDHPVLLYVRGDLTALHLPCIAIVGSRNASAGGLRHAYAFSKALSQAGFIVTSGLALGIDAKAHQAAVDLKRPTIAVMGTGWDRIYPSAHQGLARALLDEGGALVSEFPPGTPPLATHFPRRNRIISGLSTGVLVVEAALKSGSLITAKQALAQNRAVFAIPGSIDHPGSRGCHSLIRQGATLVESIPDMVDELSGFVAGYRQSLNALETEDAPPSQTEAMNALTADQQALLKQIPFSTLLMDELMLQIGTLSLSAPLQVILMELEMLDWIESTGGGVRRIR